MFGGRQIQNIQIDLQTFRPSDLQTFKVCDFEVAKTPGFSVASNLC